jgi:hypothetical protein
MRVPRGPELKAPELRAPAFLADLYYDLRDRRLLPLVALVVVAIVAVPFLLGDDREERIEPPGGGGASAGIAAVGVTGSSLTVVEATPGLRDYRKRLRGRTPTDPFKQQYTSLPKSAQLQSTSTGSSGAESGSDGSVSGEGSGAGATTGSSGGSSSGGGSGGGGSGGGGSGDPQNVRLFEFVFDVQISHSEPTPAGGRKMSKPQVRRQVKVLTQLPGEKRPVVTLGGVNLHNGKVYLLVSREARSLDGDFNCATRAPGGLCELVEIEPGFPLEVAYGPDRVAYRFKVTKIDTVPAGRAGDGRSARAGAKRAARARFDGAGLGPSRTP